MKRIIIAAAAMVLALAAAGAQSGMGIYAGLGLGFGSFGADYAIATPDFDYATGDVKYSNREYPGAFGGAFALTPVVGITPFRGDGGVLKSGLAFEFQLAMKFASEPYSPMVDISANEIRPGVLAKVNLSISDWASIFGLGGPSWGDRLVTFGAAGFGIPIRTTKIDYDSSYGTDVPDTSLTKGGFQILMEYGAGFKINDKFQLNWTMAGIGFIGHFSYDMTFGVAYHIK